MRPLLALLFIALSPCAQDSRPASSSPPAATLDAGPVTGEWLDQPRGLVVFRGIPFAAPPVGARRWLPPEPPQPWQAPRECTRFGPSCPQPSSPLVAGVVGPQDEDCLYLNVWSAGRPGETRPVLFWIHGGGCTIGSGSQSYYDGRELALRGAVVVTTNYRLGPLGFFAHEELSAKSEAKVSGNQGLRDQVAALRWAQANIAAFGGDPKKVTIFGESAGAVCCACLLVSPLAKGLFHRAILESGTASSIQTRLSDGNDSAEDQGAALLEAAGARDLAALRNKTARELIAAKPARIGIFGQGVKYGPIVDGVVLPDEPDRLFASGAFHKVPIILGTNADEATLFDRQMPIRAAAGYRLTVRTLFGTHANAVLEVFRVGADGEFKTSLDRLVTTMAFVEPARRMARAVAAHSPDVWLYHFTRKPALAVASGLGATHGAEIPYVFGSSKAVLAAPADRALADAMQRAWFGFSATGVPDAEWPRYDLEKERHLELDTPLRIAAKLLAAECDVVEKAHEARR